MSTVPFGLQRIQIRPKMIVPCPRVSMTWEVSRLSPTYPYHISTSTGISRVSGGSFAANRTTNPDSGQGKLRPVHCPPLVQQGRGSRHGPGDLVRLKLLLLLLLLLEEELLVPQGKAGVAAEVDSGIRIGWRSCKRTGRGLISVMLFSVGNFRIG